MEDWEINLIENFEDTLDECLQLLQPNESNPLSDIICLT